MEWSIPDWASVSGLILTSVLAILGWYANHKRKGSEELTQRFLVGLKAGATAEQKKQIDDELERIKASRPDRS
jgi:hypothetical protein